MARDNSPWALWAWRPILIGTLLYLRQLYREKDGQTDRALHWYLVSGMVI